MRRAAGFAAAVAGCLAASAVAQETSPPPAATFGETVEVRVANLEVTVTDHEGLPVGGLSADDFRLTVDGAEVPVQYFTEIRRGTAVEPASGGTGTAGVAGVPDLVPGEPVGTSYLVFVDDFFPLARDRDRVLRALSDDVSRLQPEDRMAVVDFDGSQLDMLTSWTDSGRELERAFRTAMSRPAGGVRRQAERRAALGARSRPGIPSIPMAQLGALDPQLDVRERFYAEQLEQQLENEVSAAAASLRSFAAPPGRKVMLLLSGGWPYDIADYVTDQFGRTFAEPSIRRGADLYAPLVDTANQVGYTLFTVDVPGLARTTATDAELQAFPDDEARFTSFLRENNEQYSLEWVAHETGGRTLVAADRFRALERAASATRSYYWIGFVPAWHGDDRRHQVKVTVRRPGLHVGARSGYVDFSRSNEVTAEVESILLFGSGPGVRPLDLELGRPGKGHGQTMSVPLRLSIPTGELTLLPAAGDRIAELELRVAAIDAHGARSEIPVIPIRLAVPKAPAPTGRARFASTLELRRTDNHLVVAVYDPVSGTLWSATADVHP